MADLLKEPMTGLKCDLDRSFGALTRVRGDVKAQADVIEEAVARFGELMRQRLEEVDTLARKAWLTSIIDRTEFNDGSIRLFGRKMY
jgi:hypothetical protein